MSDLVSIIVPVYNVEPYIEKCLVSILGQTYQNIEVIVVDNNTPDNSIRICEKYAEKDSRIKIINETEQGLSQARNAGMAHVNGEYICFVDSDDWIDPETIEESLKAIKAYQTDLVMWSYIREYDSRSAKKQLFKEDTVFSRDEIQNFLRRRIIGPYKEELRNPVMSDSFSTAWGKLYRTEIAKKYRFVDSGLIGTNEDGLYNLDYFSDINSAVYIDRYFNHYRKSEGNTMTTRYNVAKIKKWLAMIGEIEKRIDKNNEIERTAFDNRVCVSIIGQAINLCRHSQSKKEKITIMRDLLNMPVYRFAFSNLDFSYFPPHWSAFFWACKHRKIRTVLLMAEVMLRLRRYVG